MDEFEGECRECLGEGVMRQLSVKPRASWQRKQLLLWFGVGGFAFACCLEMWPKCRPQHDGVLEAAVRYMATPAKAAQHPQSHAPLFFLRVNGSDPSRTLLWRFHNAPFVVRKWSQAKQVVPKDEFRQHDPSLHPMLRVVYLDKMTKEEGVPLSLGEPQWHGSSEAWVDTPFGFGEGYLIVKWQGGNWRVTKTEQTTFF